MPQRSLLPTTTQPLLEALSHTVSTGRQIFSNMPNNEMFLQNLKALHKKHAAISIIDYVITTS